ncbi:hypothetical protein KVH_09630 [Ketogulonicigenium vulgare]|nr:hypothetical protein KVH_09630 [Ketogulonicigenium vulgare]
MDGGLVPFATARAWDAFTVELISDPVGRHPLCIGRENPPNYGGFIFVDLAVAPFDLAIFGQMSQHPIAIGIAAAGFAGLDPPAQTAMGFGGEILQEQGVHRAFEPDMHLVYPAIGERENVYACKGQVLVDCGDIGLVAR